MSIKRARELRKNATVPERAMWRLLKPFRDEGFHFRRQVPIGRYYADFVCHGKNLVIEVDGDSHGIGGGLKRDEIRTEFLQGEGYDVLRFTNFEVMNNPEGVFASVEEILE